MNQEHYQNIRDVKKSFADIEFILHTNSDIKTINKLELMLKSHLEIAQQKKNKLLAEQKSLKKE